MQVATSSAAPPDFPFVFENGKLTVNPTEEEIKKTEATLRQADANHIPQGIEGGILFDGVILRRLPNDQFGQSVWLVKPSHFVFGKGAVRSKTVELVSPSSDAGGVMLNRGKKYRIFSVNLSDKYYVWKGTVIPLD
jgi:hypothetical protein